MHEVGRSTFLLAYVWETMGKEEMRATRRDCVIISIVWLREGLLSLEDSCDAPIYQSYRQMLPSGSKPISSCWLLLRSHRRS